jgi:hypothetical protein
MSDANVVGCKPGVTEAPLFEVPAGEVPHAALPDIDHLGADAGVPQG